MERIQAEKDIFEIQGEVVQLRFRKEEAQDALDLTRVAAADQEKSLHKKKLQLVRELERIG
ncbi:hypothetical protein C1H46_017229 [Malus baccata]|uniref:Uncharacterized protein n=1 Tax=Malus baccata TaxID=106549 RepID=A0A540MEH5_MALBA|nr:hypothetical protein C1H46_017229 [Malus baccata]